MKLLKIEVEENVYNELAEVGKRTTAQLRPRQVARLAIDYYLKVLKAQEAANVQQG